MVFAALFQPGLDFRLVEAGYDLYASRPKGAVPDHHSPGAPGIIAGCLLVFRRSAPTDAAHPRWRPASDELAILSPSNSARPGRWAPAQALIPDVGRAGCLVLLCAGHHGQGEAWLTATAKTVDLRSQFGFRTIALLCLFCSFPDRHPDGVLVQCQRHRGDLFRSARAGMRRRSSTKNSNAAINTPIIAFTATVGSTIFATLAAVNRTSSHGDQPAADGPGDHHGGRDVFILCAARKGLRAQFRASNIILAHLVFCIPFAYMPIRARLEKSDLTLEGGGGGSLRHAVQRRSGIELCHCSCRNQFRRGAGLHRFVRRFHHHAIGRRAGQTTLPLYIWARSAAR